MRFTQFYANRFREIDTIVTETAKDRIEAAIVRSKSKTHRPKSPKDETESVPNRINQTYQDKTKM